MATNTVSINPCAPPQATDGPLSPFFSLNYHFGMLLGVADFETEQAYHRGKLRLHNSWLHREGVAWGMGVSTDVAAQEVRVSAGLAVDSLGRELFLEQDACVNVPAWFEAHRSDAGFVFNETASNIVFNAHVLIRFKACLTRQVPALSEPCEAAGSATAYSRVFETVELFLLPGLSVPRPLPYHRLRLLFGLDAPITGDGGLIVAADQEVLAAPKTLDSFRRFAALDEIDLRPPDETADTSVILADLTGVTLDKTGGQLRFSGATVNVAVRPAHVATSTTQELLCGTTSGSGGGGPFVIPGSFTIDETTSRIEIRTNADLQAASVLPGAFSLSTFDPATGWTQPAITAATYDAPTRRVTLSYTGPLSGALLRLIARGSGATPILGANFAPLQNGIDFVHSHRRS